MGEIRLWMLYSWWLLAIFMVFPFPLATSYLSQSSFETLGVRPEIIDAVTDMGWLLPRDVQDEAIPKILGGTLLS